MNGWAAAIMRIWLSTECLADLAAGVGAIEDRQVLGLQEQRAFQRHRAWAVDVRGFDVLLREADMLQEVEAHVGQLLVGDLQRGLQEVGAERPLVEDELDVEGGLGRGVDRFDLLVQPLAPRSRG